MRLKLVWACFFTLAGWDWRLSSRPGFDFDVKFPCNHSECHGYHRLLVRVVNKAGSVLAKKHYELFSVEAMYSEPHPALFGDGPENTYWEMVHGAGGGVESAERWVQDALSVWNCAYSDREVR